MSHVGQTHLPNKSGRESGSGEVGESEKPVEPGPEMDSDEFDARIYEALARLALVRR